LFCLSHVRRSKIKMMMKAFTFGLATDAWAIEVSLTKSGYQRVEPRPRRSTTKLYDTKQQKEMLKSK